MESNNAPDVCWWVTLLLHNLSSSSQSLPLPLLACCTPDQQKGTTDRHLPACSSGWSRGFGCLYLVIVLSLYFTLLHLTPYFAMFMVGKKFTKSEIQNRPSTSCFILVLITNFPPRSLSLSPFVPDGKLCKWVEWTGEEVRGDIHISRPLTFGIYDPHSHTIVLVKACPLFDGMTKVQAKDRGCGKL